MSFGGSEQTSQSNGKAQSYYDPRQTGLVNQNAIGLSQAVQDPNSNISYKHYSGPGLSFGDPTQLQALTNYQAPQVTAGRIGSTDLTPYMNPYTSEVINTTAAQLARQNNIDNTNAAGQATQAGAFGGSRSAVLQNLNTDSYQRNLDQTVAGLNQANFGQAQGAAGQDIASRLAADQGNQQASVASATQRAQALGLNAQQAQAIFGANWQQYINSQQDPQQLQALVNQAFGILPTSPLQTSSSSSFGQGVGYKAGV